MFSSQPLNANYRRRLAVVTGGTGGIGRAIGRDLWAAGFNVALIGRSKSKCDEVVREITAGGRGTAASPQSHILGFDCDITNTQAVGDTISAICAHPEFQEGAEKGTFVSALVNAAGLSIDKLLVHLQEKDLEAMWATNVAGAAAVSKAVVRGMLKYRSGSIVNIGSIVGSTNFAGNVGQVGYATTKAALLGMTKAMAKELGPKGIRVNMVAPGFVETGMTRQLTALDPEALAKLTSKTPLGRLVLPEDISKTVLFLLDEDSAITGQCIAVDGGFTL